MQLSILSIVLAGNFVIYVYNTTYKKISRSLLPVTLVQLYVNTAAKYSSVSNSAETKDAVFNFCWLKTFIELIVVLLK